MGTTSYRVCAFETDSVHEPESEARIETDNSTTTPVDVLYVVFAVISKKICHSLPFECMYIYDNVRKVCRVYYVTDASESKKCNNVCIVFCYSSFSS